MSNTALNPATTHEKKRPGRKDKTDQTHLRVFATARGEVADAIIREAAEHGMQDGAYLLFCRTEYLRLKAEAAGGINSLQDRVDRIETALQKVRLLSRAELGQTEPRSLAQIASDGAEAKAWIQSLLP